MVKLLGARRTTVGPDVVHSAVRGGRELFASTIGVGPDRARASTRRLLETLDVDHVVVSGIAGAIHPEMAVGTVVVPDVVIDLESGREFIPHPLGGACPDGAGGRLATSGRLVVDEGEVRGLVERGVVAIDMESAAVAEVCQASATPWSAIRCVSDRPRDGMVDDSVLQLLDEDGNADVRAALRFVLSHPRRVPDLVRLGRDSTAAARRVARSTLLACES
jgi:adenosylhomocysteine nucleosidase